MSYVLKTASAALMIVATCSVSNTYADFNPINNIVPEIEIAPLDLDWLENDDARRQSDGLPARIAVPYDTFISPGNNGIWDRTDEGLLRWQMRITSKGAPHINLGLEHWNMPPSGEMMVESTDKFSSRGPYTNEHGAEGELWLPIVSSDELMVTITCTDEDRLAVEEDVIITKINVGYRGLSTPNNRGTSESCNHDVECPLGDDWWDEIPSVGVYTISGWWTCTGFMLNNTAQDERPLFMTAQHCGLDTGSDQSLVVYWNHDNSYCRTPGSSESGGNGNGSYGQSTSGSQHLTSNSSYDVTLVELNSSPNSSYGVTFSGWSRATGSACNGSVIHHPQSAEKRISSFDYIQQQGVYWITNYDEGRTDYGSSGAPIFDCNHRVIGQLTGGSSFCSNDLNDQYGRGISGHWSSLASHLDPVGQSPTGLDTLNPATSTSGACCLNEICMFGPEDACDAVGGEFNGLGVTCSEVNCTTPPAPTGACCTGENCAEATEDDCYSGGGDYVGDDVQCQSSTCEIPVEPFEGLNFSIVGKNLVDDAEETWTLDLYARLAEGCRIDAVAGDGNQQKMISTTSSFYQHQYGGATSQSINSALFDTFPDLRYDSMVTIGLFDQTTNGLNDIGIDFAAFESGGAIDSSDGSWYVTPDDVQGMSGDFPNESCEDSNGVLIARLTIRDLSASVSIEALFQGKDASGETWQSSGSIIGITYDNCNVSCDADFDGSGIVNVADLLHVIANWGTPYDVGDLLLVISEWGCGS